MSEKCPTCRAPAVHEGERYQFDSSQYHMDAVKKLSQMSILKGEVESLTTEGGRLAEWVDSLLCDSGPISTAYKVISDHYLFCEEDQDKAMHKVKDLLESAIDGTYEGFPESPASSSQRQGETHGEYLERIGAEN